MKSGSLFRVSLRLLAFASALAAGGSLLRLKPAPPQSAAAPAPIVLERAAPAPSEPAVASDWAHLRPANIEQVIFPGCRVRDTDVFDWLPDGRALLARYREGTDHYELFAASASGVTPLREFNRGAGRKLWADRYLTPGGYMDQLPPRISAPYCLLSPDGKRLLWLEDSEVYVSVGDTPRRPDAYVVASIEGEMQREWPYDNIAPNSSQEAGYFGEEACWLRDSRRWVTPYFKQGWRAGLAVIDSRRPHSWRATRFRAARNVNCSLLGEARDGSILAEAGSNSEAGCDSLLRIRLDAPLSAPEAVTVRAPLSGYLSAVRLAPQGDKLAWLLSKDNRRALWISASSGKFPGLSTPVEVPAGLDESSLRWTPDERCITFLSSSALLKVTLPR